MPGERSAEGRSVAILLLLSLLSAAGMVRGDLLPRVDWDQVPNLERQTLPFALLAVLAAVTAVARRSAWPGKGVFWDAVLVGLGLFVAPAVLFAVAGESIPGLARIALFTLTPLFAFVFEPYMGDASGRERPAGLLAALAATAGALCIFPAALPGSFDAGWRLCTVAVMAACIGAANCHAVRVTRALPARSMAPAVTIVCATAASVFGAASALTERSAWKPPGSELLWSTLIEMSALILLFWLMARLPASRLSTHYILAPALAIFAGASWLHISLGPRTWLGLLLMACGAAYLLLAPEGKAESTQISLR
jgi:drug/metabolite transporter (DMT)-like permease